MFNLASYQTRQRLMDGLVFARYSLLPAAIDSTIANCRAGAVDDVALFFGLLTDRRSVDLDFYKVNERASHCRMDK
jgi:hypothetical protein